MPLMLVGDQRRFLTVEDERRELAELEAEYSRERGVAKERKLIGAGAMAGDAATPTHAVARSADPSFYSGHEP